MPDIDPYLIQALAQAGLLEDYLGLAHQQYGQGHELFNTPLPEGRMIGQQYFAPNFGEVLNAAARRMRGEQGMASAEQRMNDLISQYGGTAADYYRWAAKNMQQPQQTQPPANNYPGLLGPMK